MFVVYRMEFKRNEGRVIGNSFTRLEEFKTLEEAEAYMHHERKQSDDEDVSFTIVME